MNVCPMSTRRSVAMWTLLWSLWVSTTIGSFIRKPEDTEVVRGSNVSISCSISVNGDYCADWYHIPVGATNRHDVFLSCSNIRDYYPRFKVSRDDFEGQYNLTITSVDYGDAGTYVCVDTAGKEANAELIVLESTPNGHLNAGSEPLVICGNKTQALSFSCDVGYSGKIEPILHWQQLLRGNVINCTNDTLDRSTGRVVSNLSVEVNYNTIESSYICKTKLSQFSWTSDKLNIQYAVMVSSGETSYKTEEQVVFCEVDSNRPCRRHQVINDEGKNVLQTECFNSSNDVFCRFECEFPQNTGSPNYAGWKTACITLIVIGIVCIALLVCSVLLCKYGKCKQRQRRDAELPGGNDMELAPMHQVT